MELACVVTPVESYEDISNLHEDSLHQDPDPSLSKSIHLAMLTTVLHVALAMVTLVTTYT